ncbi:hypothetical protein [Intestinimonas butyriciproducens]|uniref:hypothetical protein n=1 Tax=Intestinimonas butyriciproducens TaxID=1297617 RepID=UPI00051BAB05|nr:hypothetical protein [Intestinimonas butyriciproducens]
MSDTKKEKKKYMIGGVEVTDIKQINLEIIRNHIKTLEEKDIEWLISVLEEKIPNGEDKKGNPKTKKRPFIEIRNEFARRYCPDLAPKGTSKDKKSVIDETLEDLRRTLAEKRS